jgi:4-hydroxy-tetrahydrodipicolinate synthase
VIALGGAGLISVASNVIPRQMSDMVEAALANDWTTARRIHRQFFRLLQANFAEPSPAPVKALLAICGFGEDILRLPMVPVTRALRARLEQMAGELGLLIAQPPTGEDLRMF